MVGIARGKLDSPVPHAEREDQIGDVARAVASFRDVSTERLQAQDALKRAHDEMEERVRQRTEELRRTEALFRSVIAASPAEIFVRDAKGRMLLVEDKETLMQRMGKKQMDIHLQKPADQLPKGLNGYNLERSDDGCTLTYTYDTHAERTGITKLLGELDKAGICYHDLSTSQSSLEEIFVDLVNQPQ